MRVTTHLQLIERDGAIALVLQQMDHEAESPREVCLTVHIHVVREAHQHGIAVLGKISLGAGTFR
ncbi:MAG: hypothetical protein IPO40_23615 [Fibrobacteres bacterium]|nr:hypothetical protein [Fibrobacterota bacterium]